MIYSNTTLTKKAAALDKAEALSSAQELICPPPMGWPMTTPKPSTDYFPRLP
jgi:hypothetical protein